MLLDRKRHHHRTRLQVVPLQAVPLQAVRPQAILQVVRAVRLVAHQVHRNLTRSSDWQIQRSGSARMLQSDTQLITDLNKG